MNLVTEMQKFFDSEEGKAKIQIWADEIIQKKSITDSQLCRYYLKYGDNLTDIINKIKIKYESDTYVNKWMGKGIEPPEPLYWQLFEYAKKYGTEATINEYEEFGNTFTSEMYNIGNFYISRMDGQGSIIKIIKI